MAIINAWPLSNIWNHVNPALQPLPIVQVSTTL